jgi:hypothetical protein
LQQAVAVVVLSMWEEQVVVRRVVGLLVMLVTAVRKVQVVLEVPIIFQGFPPQPQVRQGKEVMARECLLQRAPVVAVAVGMAGVAVVTLVVLTYAPAVAALATLAAPALLTVVWKMACARAMVG